MLAYLIAVGLIGAIIGSAFGYYLGRRDAAREYGERMELARRYYREGADEAGTIRARDERIRELERQLRLKVKRVERQP